MSWNAAETYCDLALEYEADNGDALVNRGIVEMKRGNHDAAKKWFIKALRSNNEQAQAYNNLAILYQQDGQYDRAAGELPARPASGPRLPQRPLQPGGHPAQAEAAGRCPEELRKILAVNPSLAEPHYLLALIAFEQGQRGRGAPAGAPRPGASAQRRPRAGAPGEHPDGRRPVRAGPRGLRAVRAGRSGQRHLPRQTHRIRSPALAFRRRAALADRAGQRGAIALPVSVHLHSHT